MEPQQTTLEDRVAALERQLLELGERLVLTERELARQASAVDGHSKAFDDIISVGIGS